MKSNNTLNHLSSEQIIEKIEATLNHLHGVFEDAFAGGKKSKNLNKVEFHSAALFNQIWGILNDKTNFDTEKELNSHYIYIQLRNIINKYVDGISAKDLPDDAKKLFLEDDFIKLFEEIRKIHQVLVRMKFLLKQVGAENTPELFKQRINELVQYLEKIKLVESQPAITNMLDQFELTLLNVKLKFKMTEVELGLESRNNDVSGSKSIKSTLARLDFIEELNKDILPKYHEAHDKKNKEEINKYRQKIEEKILILQDVQNLLYNALNMDATALDKIQHDYCDKGGTLARELPSLERKYQLLMQIYDLVKNIAGDNNDYTKRGYLQLNIIAKNATEVFKSGRNKKLPVKIGGEVADIINHQCQMLSDDIKQLTEVYHDENENLNQIKSKINFLKINAEETNDIADRMRYLVAKAKEITSICFERINGIVDELKEHITIHANFLTSSIHRNWKPISLGSTAGTVVGVVVSAAFLFNPVVSGIAIPGCLVVGGMAGWIFKLGTEEYRRYQDDKARKAGEAEEAAAAQRAEEKRAQLANLQKERDAKAARDGARHRTWGPKRQNLPTIDDVVSFNKPEPPRHSP